MTQPEHEMIPAWVEGGLMPLGKLEVHLRGLRHRAVSVFVLSGNGAGGDSVLIQRRALSKYHTPGLWANTCCTHPRWSEEPRACALRRLDEELGITGLDPVLAGQVEYRADVGGGMTEHEVVDIFTARAAPGLAVTPNPDEVMAVRWIPLRDLVEEVTARPGIFTPWLRIYLRDHRADIFGT